MKYLLLILLFGCATTKHIEPVDEYGEEELYHRGDTIFWRGKELGFLLTQEETKEWVVMKMEKTYDRYSVWVKKNDSLIFRSVISNERYYLRGEKMEYVLQPEYGEKYVREIN